MQSKTGRRASFVEPLESRVMMSVTGNVIRETWLGVPGSGVSDIPLTTTPTKTTSLTQLEIAQNDGPDYADRIRGTITAPTTGVYTFWIAGDDSNALYLSNNSSDAGKTRIAYVNGSTTSRQWTKYKSQKSAAITLIAGNEYYFEVLHKQGPGKTNLAVGWAKPGEATAAPSQIIGADVLGQFGSTPTPPTPPPTTAGTVLRETWTNIAGNSTGVIPVNTTPNKTALLTSLETPTNDGFDYGDRIRGFITAPSTGLYTFWLSGDDNSEFYLSNSDSALGKSRIAYFSGSTTPRQWTKFASQKSKQISLTSGQKYYFEVLHKQGPGKANLAVGWAKPGEATTAPSEVIGASVISQYVPPVVTPVPTTEPTITPTATPGLSVKINAGKYVLPNGTTVDVQDQTLAFDAPELATHTYTGEIPGNRTNGNNDGFWGTLSPRPPVDTLLLGGLMNAIIPESVVVKNEAGTKTFVRNVDYYLNEGWGQIANINNRLGAPGSGNLKVTYKYVKQRLDLIQLGLDGTLSIKKGASAVVVPTLPKADDGKIAFAGIYVYTMDGARETNFKINTADIFPIKPAAPVAPINPDAIPSTLAKLQSGGSVNIAWFGDSITLGAEAGKWWEDRSLTYTGKTMAALKAKYPTATITETAAYRGGLKGSEPDAQTSFTNDVVNAANHVDLVVIALGMNDNETAKFKTAIEGFIAQAKANGTEVLLVSPMQSNPFLEALSNNATRADIAQTLCDVAAEKHVAMADVWQEWQNQTLAGTPAFSQIHNWLNHPGVPGHQLYSNTIMRFF